MTEFLYMLIIFPVEQAIEVCFYYGFKWFKNAGTAILVMSVAVSTFILPIYLMADKQQRRQREIEKGLKKGIDLIKSTFKGDERFMLLSTYYRQNGYHPISSLRNSIDLLIQIPFFIAAYHFLHNHPEVLSGTPFLFIPDLGAPDRLLFGLNLLPILMTVINIVSGMVYAKDLASKDKVQLYVMAAVFLVLLYNSPSALVLYWTSNNVYNLVKNILQSMLLAGAPRGRAKKEKPPKPISDEAASANSRIFILSALSLCFLGGLTIPAGVISSEVSEFAFTGKYTSPLSFVYLTFVQSLGFLLWAVIVYSLLDRGGKRYMALAALFIFVNAILNCFCFQVYHGQLTKDLMLTNMMRGAFVYNHITLLIALVVSAGVALLASRRKCDAVIYSVLSIGLMSFLAMGVINSAKIQKEFSIISEYPDAANSKNSQVYTFSQTGKNVLVLMLDRAISGFLPYIIEERPDVAEALDGFTYFPNTMAFGNVTIFSVPAIFGGYHYTPAEIQKRGSEPFIKKYMESMQVLPQIFGANGFKTVASDLSLVTPARLSAFSQSENIKYEFTIGKHISRFIEEHKELGEKDYESILKNNLVRFSLFRSLPPMMRRTFYDNGDYMKIKRYFGIKGHAVGSRKMYSARVIRSYSHLHYLKDMTSITEDNGNFANLIVNEMTHDPVLLKLPDYTLIESGAEVDSGYKFLKDGHYHANAASFLLLKRYFDFLKENNVFDNTRIIIVSDHGRTDNGIIVPLDKYPLLPNGRRAEGYAGLLLFKDFGRNGEMKTDSTFMTVADVPVLATGGIIENPANPFTTQLLSTDKDSGIIFTINDQNWNLDQQKKYSYNIKDNEWYHVKENIFVPENWTRYSVKE